ncbi:S1 family peptidase [Paenibacillus arenosi]|uniref:Serine protease n=1 Tax=Paenibacillus arenosi TaxID=2774142 RepID=A0ABR9B041_9BACL|nr:S1 family peptidase [Paenibacillus arenosi]MBD8499264.1 hypothetical protein [Paenibacillus arenosi]
MKTKISLVIIFTLILVNSVAFAEPEKQNIQENKAKVKIEKNDNINYNIGKRKMLGLDSEKSTVEKIVLQSNTENVTYEDFYLTVEEKEILDRRFKHQNEYIPKLKQSAIRALTEEQFGGIYVNQEEGGVVYIGIKEMAKSNKDNLSFIKEIYGDTSNVKFINTRYSEEELLQTADALFNSKSLLSDAGIEIQYTALDTINNVVEVGLINNTEENQKYLIEKYGDKLTFYTADPSDFQNEGDQVTATNPVQGGVQILNDTAQKLCSVGFSAKSNAGEHFLVTAGHCYGNGSLNTFYHPDKAHSNKIIAGGHIQHVKNSGNVDAMLIGVHKDFVTNKVYFQYVGSKSLTSYAKDSSEFVGQHVCIASRSNDTCGTILSTSLSAGPNTNLTAASYMAIGGDSGGTIFGNSVLHGVHTGNGSLSGNAVEVYSQVEHILKHFNIVPILN